MALFYEDSDACERINSKLRRLESVSPLSGHVPEFKMEDLWPSDRRAAWRLAKQGIQHRTQDRNNRNI